MHSAELLRQRSVAARGMERRRGESRAGPDGLFPLQRHPRQRYRKGLHENVRRRRHHPTLYLPQMQVRELQSRGVKVA